MGSLFKLANLPFVRSSIMFRKKLNRESVTRRAEAPRDGSMDLGGQRELWPAVSVSFAGHVLLILILSLVALHGQPSRPALEFSARDTVPVAALSELPSFSVQQPVAVLAPPMRVSAPELELSSVDIPRPPEIESKPIRLLPAAAKNADPESLEDGTPTAAVAVSIQRRVSQAGGQTGEVQFALAWKDINDVDLHVVTPAGEHISHLHKRSADRGMLDVDMNVRGESLEPVENVRWISQAPWGRYTVIVNLFRIHPPNALSSRVYRGSAFQLLAQLGTETQILKETVTGSEQVAVFHFRYVASGLPDSQREILLAELEQLQQAEEAAAQPLLEKAKSTKTLQLRERLLNNLIQQYPHTDAAIAAMRLLGGEITKS
jgi:hypothetical protein